MTVRLAEHRDRVYQNNGNRALLALLENQPALVLDVGCGAGDNASLLRSQYPTCEIHGVTRSPAEAAIAKRWMTECWIFDIEGDIPNNIGSMRFDAIIFSHVLEHLRNPAEALQKFAKLLKPGGYVIVAVPNVLFWAMRWRFFLGDFEYKSDGVLDNTHLRFFTYRTADRYLLTESPRLKLVSKGVTGSVPQWWLRRYLLPKACSVWIDEFGCRIWPNLFGEQVLFKAVDAHSHTMG